MPVNSFEQILNFIENYVDATKWGYQTNCEGVIIENLYLEEDYQYFFIDKDDHRTY